MFEEDMQANTGKSSTNNDSVFPIFMKLYSKKMHKSVVYVIDASKHALNPQR